jgi:hypothetical protein
MFKKGYEMERKGMKKLNQSIIVKNIINKDDSVTGKDGSCTAIVTLEPRSSCKERRKHDLVFVK